MKASTTTAEFPPLTAPLCLASASPRRAAILRDAGLRFEIDPAEVDESLWLDETGPKQAAVLLATEKARAVALRHPDDIILAADTLVVLDGRILGKPDGADDAREMLEQLKGRSHQVITGVAVLYGETSAADAEMTDVKMRDYTLAEMNAYIGTASPLDKAGGYGIQDEPFNPAYSISGCYLNVVGLPLCLTSRLLKSAGGLIGEKTLACATHDTIGRPA